MSTRDEMYIRNWLSRAWLKTSRVVVLEGGEADVAIQDRSVRAVIDDPDTIRLLRDWMTVGEFSGDICRCGGDLTLALYGKSRELVGSASVHVDRISWERASFQNDIVSSKIVNLRLLLARFGVDGASQAVLEPLISALGLHEGELQFRPRGSLSHVITRQVPLALAEQMAQFSGEESGALEDERVERLAMLIKEAELNPEVAVRQLLGWLGKATWPAEAIAGDGALARRILDHYSESVIIASLPNLVSESEIMGAVAWSAFKEHDAAIMSLMSSKIEALLAAGS